MLPGKHGYNSRATLNNRIEFIETVIEFNLMLRILFLIIYPTLTNLICALQNFVTKEIK